jgi:hypothetical protein
VPNPAPAAFLDWILSPSGPPAWLVDSAAGQVLARSPVLADLPADAPWWESELAVEGEPGRTALAVGLGGDAGSLRLWLTVPLEGETPDSDILLLLLLGSVPDNLAPAQRLREAFAERDSRHAINQPLTAMTFLLENLLFACRAGAVESRYLGRKREQLAEQLERLGALLREAGALPASPTI